MPQPDLIQRAQQGDLAAIATLLNRNLQPRGVTAKVAVKDGCLKILLSADRSLNQLNYARFVQTQVHHFRPKTVERVKLYFQQVGDEMPTWSQEIAPPLSRPVAIATPAPQPAQPETQDFLTTLKTFQLDTVFPYHAVLQAELYRHPMVKLLLFFGLFPLVVDLFADWASLAQTAWLLGIYYACIWGVVLHDLIKPTQFSWNHTLKCILFTVFVGIPLLLSFQRVPPFNALYAAIGAGPIPRVVGFVFGVGVLEEVCKALSVYLLLLRPGKLNDPLTAAFYGAMSGLGFAIAEGATYSLLYAFGLSRGELGLGSYVIANTIRFVSLPLFHAILAGIVGYFIGLAAINPSRQSAILFIGLAIAASLHGLYNSFAGSPVGLLIIGFSILLFVTYLHRSQQIVAEMQQAELRQQRISLPSNPPPKPGA